MAGISGAIVPATAALESDRPAADIRAVQLAREWLITRKSGHTRYSYGLDIGIRVPRPGAALGSEPRPPAPAKAPSWLDWCSAIGADPLHATETHLAGWARGMEAAGLSAPTVARKISAVSSWYQWLVRNKHAAHNPAESLPRPEV
ncbi:MAG: site-specific integrase, partial [Streptosporangiaceae bacterium]